MTLDIAIRYLIVWSAVGAFAFCIYVFAVFRGGLVYTARKQDGTLKERIPLSGILNMLLLLLIIVGFQILANYYGLARSGLTIPFMVLFLLNFVHYIILFLFDTLVIDGLVIGVWRPEFLRLPDDMGAESMKKHMLKSIPVGIVAGVALTVISTAISYFAMFAG
ncbi:MAG: hypothetical protein P8Z42_07420 [Anaerolineales bacterium]|jgi:hypothetical protein